MDAPRCGQALAAASTCLSLCLNFRGASQHHSRQVRRPSLGSPGLRLGFVVRLRPHLSGHLTTGRGGNGVASLDPPALLHSSVWAAAGPCLPASCKREHPLTLNAGPPEVGGSPCSCTS